MPDPEYQILSLKKKGRSGSRVLLTFQPEREPLEIPVEVFAQFRLSKETRLSEDFIERLREADELFRCRQRAWSLLARKPRSKAELTQALRQRRFNPSSVSTVVRDLERGGYIDDTEFARQFVADKLRGGKSGPQLVRSQLAARGVPRQIAEAALSPLNESSHQEQAARDLLTVWNRRPKPGDPRKRRQAAAAYLMRRGFSPDIVWDLVREVIVSEQDD